MSFTKEDAKIILQDILNKEFPTVSEKRKIVTRDKEFAFSCPVCNDSEKHLNKKRGTLYFNSFRYRCFNCGCKTTLLGLLKRFNIDIDPEKKSDIIDYVSEATQRIHFSEDEFITKDLDKLINLSDLEKYLNNDINSTVKSFKPITKGSKVWKYLTGRKIYDFDNLYEGVYYYTPDWFEPVLVNLNHSKGKILGIQTRNLRSEKNKRKYRIFSFSELWDMLNPSVELDEIERIGYNRLSYLYNILNVSWDEPITIFEGALDTKFFPNSIGCVGTNTDINFILNQEADIRFFYDYDTTGIKKSLEMIGKEYSVFLWERMFDFWSDKTSNPTKAGRELRVMVKDLNDVAKLIDNPYQKLNMIDYFSRDELDKIYIKSI
jgi:hypothetical protein